MQMSVDNEFPPNLNSLISISSASDDVELAEYLNSNQVDWEFINNIIPNFNICEKFDENLINQGNIGNCSFISCLICLAIEGSSISKIIEYDRNQQIVYVNYFANGLPNRLKIDLFFPIIRETRKLIFVKPIEKSIWPMILEKAWAKFWKSYLNSYGNLISSSMYFLTGSPIEVINIASTNLQDTIKFIKKSIKHKWFLACTSKQVLANEFESIIEKNHAYSIKEIQINTQNDINSNIIITLMNPWGTVDSNQIDNKTNLINNKLSEYNKIMKLPYYTFNCCFSDIVCCKYNREFLHNFIELDKTKFEYIFKVNTFGKGYISFIYNNGTLFKNSILKIILFKLKGDVDLKYIKKSELSYFQIDVDYKITEDVCSFIIYCEAAKINESDVPIFITYSAMNTKITSINIESNEGKKFVNGICKELCEFNDLEELNIERNVKLKVTFPFFSIKFGCMKIINDQEGKIAEISLSLNKENGFFRDNNTQKNILINCLSQKNLFFEILDTSKPLIYTYKCFLFSKDNLISLVRNYNSSPCNLIPVLKMPMQKGSIFFEEANFKGNKVLIVTNNNPEKICLLKVINKEEKYETNLMIEEYSMQIHISDPRKENYLYEFKTINNSKKNFEFNKIFKIESNKIFTNEKMICWLTEFQDCVYLVIENILNNILKVFISVKRNLNLDLKNNIFEVTILRQKNYIIFFPKIKPFQPFNGVLEFELLNIEI